MSNLELLGKKQEPHNVIRAEVQRSGEHVAAASIIGVHIVRSVGTRASNEGSRRLREDFTINDIRDRLVSIMERLYMEAQDGLKTIAPPIFLNIFFYFLLV